MTTADDTLRHARVSAGAAENVRIVTAAHQSRAAHRFETPAQRFQRLVDHTRAAHAEIRRTSRVPAAWRIAPDAQGLK